MADSAYLAALKLLARRELSVEGLRARLVERDYPSDAIAAAIEHLLETGALDDARVARAYARTAASVKGRGRLRIQRELVQMGVSREIAVQTLAEVFGDLDERSLITKALQKKLRGRMKIADQHEYARLYQYLMRQGFSPAGVVQALRKLRGGSRHGDDE